MAEFKAYTPGIEVSGRAILAVIEGMGAFKERGYEILTKHGLENVNPDGWYPQQPWLDALKEIYELIGPVTLRLIGLNVGQNMQIPPETKSIEEALQVGDVTFHIAHRKNGKPMFDPETGKMEDGIGHYSCEKTGERSMKMVCSNPYPCVFDLGLAEATCKRFKPQDSLRVKVVHDEEKECRRKGGDSCTHNVSW